MGIWTCRHCNAHNDSPGRCVACLRALGDPKRALIAGLICTLALGALWVGAAWLLRFQLSWGAVLFGGVVSGVVTSRSGGRGIFYQAVASSFTVAGILLSQSLVMFVLWEDLYHGTPRPGFWRLASTYALYDPVHTIFAVLGVMGGLYIWHGGTPADDL